MRRIFGRASYYSDALKGRPMANGETYEPQRAVAAHRSLRFGTVVRVVHASSGASVVVRITDRGPFARGRIIDLSRGAAERLNMVKEGVARVKIEVLKQPQSR